LPVRRLNGAQSGRRPRFGLVSFVHRPATNPAVRRLNGAQSGGIAVAAPRASMALGQIPLGHRRGTRGLLRLTGRRGRPDRWFAGTALSSREGRSQSMDQPARIADDVLPSEVDQFDVVVAESLVAEMTAAQLPATFLCRSTVVLGESVRLGDCAELRPPEVDSLGHWRLAGPEARLQDRHREPAGEEGGSGDGFERRFGSGVGEGHRLAGPPHAWPATLAIEDELQLVRIHPAAQGVVGGDDGLAERKLPSQIDDGPGGRRTGKVVGTEQFVAGQACSSYDDVGAQLIPPRGRWPREPDRLDRWCAATLPITPDEQTVQLRRREVTDHRAGVGGLGARGTGDHLVYGAIEVMLVVAMEPLVAHQSSQIMVPQPEPTQRCPRLRHGLHLSQPHPNFVSQPFHTDNLPRRGRPTPPTSRPVDNSRRQPDLEHHPATDRAVRRPNGAQSRPMASARIGHWAPLCHELRRTTTQSVLKVVLVTSRRLLDLEHHPATNCAVRRPSRAQSWAGTYPP
jgi:hypothetical protein